MNNKIDNNRYSIFTPNGFESFDGVNISKKEYYIEIIFNNNAVLKCTSDHILFDSNYNEVFAKDVNIGQYIIGVDGDICVNNIILHDEVELFYDIRNVKNHKYFTNGVLSHNCDCDLATSGHTVVPHEVLEWYKANHIKTPIFMHTEDDGLWIWEYPEAHKSYLVSGDVARGDGDDYSTFHVFNVENMEQVAEYKGQIGTPEFAELLLKTARDYNNALLSCENASIGWDVVTTLVASGYENLYYAKRKNPYEVISKENKDVPGYSTTGKTRPNVINKIETVLTAHMAIIHSQRLYDELVVFKWINGKAQAETGYNDDLAMAAGMGFTLMGDAIESMKHEIEYSKQIVGNITSGLRANNVLVTTGMLDPWTYVEKGHKMNLKDWL